MARFAALLIALAGAGLALGAAVAAPGLTRARWIHPEADLVAALSTQPAECLMAPADADRAWSVEVGRAAFRSSALLGGEAARQGLTCEACHLNGRGNEHFSFPGLSGAAGTADVTSSLMSTHRNDNLDNPKPIPDLGGFGKALVVVRTPMRPDLRDFIEKAVTEEFDGSSPPAAVLEGLADYTRALAPDHCPRPLVVPVTLAGEMSDVRRAGAAAQEALRRKDAQTALAMLDAARDMLGRIAERFAAVPSGHAALVRADRKLAQTAADVRAGRPQAIAAWVSELSALEDRLARSEAKSLYAPAQLARIYGAK